MNGSDTAFPLAEWNAGMKKRELIAAMALQGIMAGIPDGCSFNPKVAAEAAIAHADALIELL